MQQEICRPPPKKLVTDTGNFPHQKGNLQFRHRKIWFLPVYPLNCCGSNSPPLPIHYLYRRTLAFHGRNSLFEDVRDEDHEKTKWKFTRKRHQKPLQHWLCIGAHADSSSIASYHWYIKRSISLTLPETEHCATRPLTSCSTYHVTIPTLARLTYHSWHA